LISYLHLLDCTALGRSSIIDHRLLLHTVEHTVVAVACPCVVAAFAARPSGVVRTLLILVARTILVVIPGILLPKGAPRARVGPWSVLAVVLQLVLKPILRAELPALLGLPPLQLKLQALLQVVVPVLQELQLEFYLPLTLM
jgi:hypothetical protein